MLLLGQFNGFKNYVISKMINKNLSKKLEIINLLYIKKKARKKKKKKNMHLKIKKSNKQEQQFQLKFMENIIKKKNLNHASFKKLQLK